MKRNFVFIAIALFAFASAVSAQKATDFSGTWTLDVSKSKLDTRMPIESQTLVVTQTATELKVDQTTKRAAPPVDAAMQGQPPGGRGGRGGRGGMMGNTDGSTTYALDGKDVKSTVSGPMGEMQVTTKAKLDGSTIEITRSFSTPMGDRTSTEKWTLSSDGTLTIESQRPNREGGTDTTLRTFTKKQ